jgi:hypothetical protein
MLRGGEKKKGKRWDFIDQIKGIGAKESIIALPRDRRLDLPLGIFVEEDVEGDAGSDEGGFDVVGAVVDGEDGCESVGG